MGPRKMHKLRSGKYLFMSRFLKDEWKVEDQEKGNYDTVDNASIDVVWLSLQTFLREQGYDVNYCSKILLGKLLHQAGVEKVKRGPRNQQKFYYFPLRPVSGSRSEVILSSDCRSRYNTRSFYLNLCKTKPEHYTMSSPSLGNVSVAVLYDRSLSLQKFESGVLRRMCAKYSNDCQATSAVTTVAQTDVMKELFPEEETDVDYLINKSIDMILGGGRSFKMTFSNRDEISESKNSSSAVTIEEIPSTSNTDNVKQGEVGKKVGRPKGSKTSKKNPNVEMNPENMSATAPKKRGTEKKKGKRVERVKEEGVTINESNTKPKRKYKQRKSKVETDEAKALVNVSGVRKPKRKYKPRNKKRKLDETEMLESASKCEISFPDFYNHLELNAATENKEYFAYSQLHGHSAAYSQQVDQPLNYGQQVDQPLNYGQQVDKPLNYGQQVDQPLNYGQLVDQPLSYGQLVDQPLSYGQLVDQPLSYGQQVDQSLNYENQVIVNKQPGKKKRGRPLGSKTKNRKSGPAEESSKAKGNRAKKKLKTENVKTPEEVDPCGTVYPDFFTYYEMNDDSLSGSTYQVPEQSLLYHQTHEEVPLTYHLTHTSLLNSTGDTSHEDSSYDLQTPPSHNYSFYF